MKFFLILSLVLISVIIAKPQKRSPKPHKSATTTAPLPDSDAEAEKVIDALNDALNAAPDALSLDTLFRDSYKFNNCSGVIGTKDTFITYLNGLSHAVPFNITMSPGDSYWMSSSRLLFVTESDNAGQQFEISFYANTTDTNSLGYEITGGVDMSCLGK